MKISKKQSIALILLSVVVSMVGALPMILDRNKDFLMPCLILSNIIFLVGFVFLVKNIMSRKPQANS